jgi:hypothetical protein
MFVDVICSLPFLMIGGLSCPFFAVSLPFLENLMTAKNGRENLMTAKNGRENLMTAKNGSQRTNNDSFFQYMKINHVNIIYIP